MKYTPTYQIVCQRFDILRAAQLMTGRTIISSIAAEERKESLPQVRLNMDLDVAGISSIGDKGETTVYFCGYWPVLRIFFHTLKS